MSGLLSLASSRRSCGKVGIPRSLRDFQGRWESPLLDFSTERLFHSLRGRSCRYRRALAGVMHQPPWPMSDAQSAVQMLVNDDLAAGQCATPAHLVDLQGQVLKADSV